LSRKIASSKYNFSLLDEGIELLKDGNVVDWERVFGNKNSIVFEVGCGNGHFLVQKASENPDKNFIGIDIKPERVIKSIEKKIKLSLKNILFFVGEGEEFINRYFDDDSLTLVYLLFPDPWPKKRHHKKRLLLKEGFVNALSKKLKIDGGFIYVTDHQDYFDVSYDKISKDVRFVLESKSDNDEYSISIFGNKWKEAGRDFFSFVLKRHTV